MIPAHKLAVVSLIGFGVSMAAMDGARAQAPGAGFDFDTIRGSAKQGRVLLDGTFDYLAGDAKLVITYTDPEKPALEIRADRIEFGYGSAPAGVLQTIFLKNNVSVVHPSGTVTADAGEWDAEANTITFTSAPPRLCNVERTGVTATGARVTMDLAKGYIGFNDFNFEGAFGELRAGREPAAPVDPSLLTLDDVDDWPGLLGKVKAQDAAQKTSPGKRIMALLDEDTRNSLRSIDPDAQLTDRNKQAVLKRINEVLRNPDLYEKNAWQGVDIAPEAAALLERGADTLGPQQATRLNRLLIEAAYPNAIVRAKTPAPAGD